MLTWCEYIIHTNGGMSCILKTSSYHARRVKSHTFRQLEAKQWQHFRHFLEYWPITLTATSHRQTLSLLFFTYFAFKEQHPLFCFALDFLENWTQLQTMHKAAWRPGDATVVLSLWGCHRNSSKPQCHHTLLTLQCDKNHSDTPSFVTRCKINHSNES